MVGLTSSRRNRLILISAVLVLLLWAGYTARNALFTFAVGLVVGYIILPLVNFLDRHMGRVLGRRKTTRGFAIVIVYLLVALVVGIIIAFLIPILSDQVGTLQRQLPYLITRGGELLREWLGQYRKQLPVDVDKLIADNTNRIVTEVTNQVQEGVKQTFNVVTTTISFIIGITIIPVWLFYVLLDEAHSKRMTLEMIPRPNRPDALSIYRIVDTTLGAYLRGQLILGTSVWFFATAALLAIGVEPALLLGIAAGVLELLPNIGPVVSLISITFIALLQSPAKALWTAIAFVIIQQIESNFLVPQITSNSVRLHPALVIIAIVVGNEIAGLWGMLLIVPLTAVIRDVVKYLYLRFSDVEVSPEDALAIVQGRPIDHAELPLEISLSLKEE